MVLMDMVVTGTLRLLRHHPPPRHGYAALLDPTMQPQQGSQHILCSPLPFLASSPLAHHQRHRPLKDLASHLRAWRAASRSAHPGVPLTSNHQAAAVLAWITPSLVDSHRLFVSLPAHSLTLATVQKGEQEVVRVSRRYRAVNQRMGHWGGLEEAAV